MRHLRLVLPALIVVSSLLSASTLRADDDEMRCRNEVPAKHEPLAAGDHNTPSQLQVTRELPANASIDLDVCAAELTVVGDKGNTLRVSINFDDPNQHSVGDYLQKLKVSGEQATVKLALPENVHAQVTVTIPSKTPELNLNLVYGNLSLDAARIEGNRNINVVKGDADIVGDPDAYESLSVNVVMGRFYEFTKGGSRPLLVSRSLSGNGSGSIDVNVVSGSVYLKTLD